MGFNAMGIWIQTTQQKHSAGFVLLPFGKGAVGQGMPHGQGMTQENPRGCRICPSAHQPSHTRGAAEPQHSLPTAATSDEFLPESSELGAGKELYKILHNQSSGTYFLSQCN